MIDDLLNDFDAEAAAARAAKYPGASAELIEKLRRHEAWQADPSAVLPWERPSIDDQLACERYLCDRDPDRWGGGPWRWDWIEAELRKRGAATDILATMIFGPDFIEPPSPPVEPQPHQVAARKRPKRDDIPAVVEPVEEPPRKPRGRQVAPEGAEAEAESWASLYGRTVSPYDTSAGARILQDIGATHSPWGRRR